MLIATWNVNSVRARHQRLLDWLDKRRPDVVCLQELKVEDSGFPLSDVESRGYHAALYGQRTYNGVAILSRRAPTDVARGLDGDEQARLIAANIGDTQFISAYFPNGGEKGSDKFEYKLRWMKQLAEWLGPKAATDRVVLCGDFNVAPFEDDVAHNSEMEGSVLACDEVRTALTTIRDLGFIDAFRPFHPKGGVYSWWDYRAGAFEAGNGLRIDHVYCTPAVAERAIGALVETEERRGKGASDHAPVMVELEQ